MSEQRAALTRSEARAQEAIAECQQLREQVAHRDERLHVLEGEHATARQGRSLERPAQRRASSRTRGAEVSARTASERVAEIRAVHKERFADLRQQQRKTPLTARGLAEQGAPPALDVRAPVSGSVTATTSGCHRSHPGAGVDRMKKTPWYSSVIALLSAALLVGASTTTASADSDQSPPVDGPSASAQLAMTVFDRYNEDPAYGGMSEDADGNLTVMWKDGAAGPAGLPASVTVVRTAYSETELARAAEQLAAAGREDGVTSVGASSDRAGLTVTMQPPATTTRSTLSAAQSFDATGLEPADIPVLSVTYEAPASDAFGRQSTAGGQGVGGQRIKASNGTQCTAGFPVTFNSNGAPGMASANHCRIGGGDVWYDGGSGSGRNFFGGNGTYSASYDVYVLRSSAGSQGMLGYAPFVFMGAWNGTSTAPQQMPYLVGWTPPSLGATWVLSGSFSGSVSGNVIEAYPVSVNFDFGTATVAQLRNTAGIGASGSGDSGGPAVRWNTTETVLAGGTIVGHSVASETTCKGVTTGRRCGTVTYISPYSSWRSLLGVTVMSAAG